MKKSFYFWSIALLFLFGTAFASALMIYGVMPNTDDDVNEEYIDLYNNSCEIIDLTGVYIQDLSQKKYMFTGGILEPGSHKIIYRPETKIILNNTDESLQIFDANGSILHQIEYDISDKNIPIEWPISQPNCQVIVTTEETTTEIIPEETIQDETVLSTVPQGVESPVLQIPSISQTETATGEVQTESSQMSTILDISSQTGSNTSFDTGSTQSLGENTLTDSGSMIPMALGVFVLGTLSGNILSDFDSTSSGNLLYSTLPTDTGATVSGVILSQETQANSGVTPPGVIGSSNLSTDSGSIFSGSILTDTGISLEGVPHLNILLQTNDTTILTPQQLYLYDTDNNSKIDRFIVQYSGTLSGVLLAEKLIIFSASGGLADSTIETGSGVIKSLSYSGSDLIIDIFEQNLIHLDLNINDSTSSGLRLKTLSQFGLTNMSGIPVLPLTFTQSFDGYSEKYIHNTALPMIPYTTEISTSQASNSSIIVSPSITSSTYTSSSIITPTLPRVLPEPTILFQSGITPQGFCSGKTCRVNVIHTPQEKFEMCRWQIVSGSGTGFISDGCNPKAVTLGYSGGTISLTLLDSAGILPFKFNSFHVLPFQSEVGSAQSTIIKTSTPVLPKFSETSKNIKKQTGSTLSKEEDTLPKTISKKPTMKKSVIKSPVPKKTVPKKTATKKVTTTTTTSTKSGTSSPKKEAKAMPIAPITQKSQTPSDSVTLGIIGIACAGIGFSLALLRRKDQEIHG